MATLHIEHAVTDLTTWQGAFDAFAEARAAAGVEQQRVRHPLDDPHYVVIDLDFPTTETAEAFLAFLRAHVWSTPAASPALVGAPQARVLVDVAPG